MITAADYADWCQFAGLYLANISHADRYRTYQEKLSRHGVVVRVVYDFLGDNKGGIDLSSWRSYSVYEMGGDAQFRLDLTADALASIGATRTAAKVRSVQDTSPSALLLQNMGDFEGFMQAMHSGGAEQMISDLQKSLARALPEEAAELGLPVPGSEPVPVDAEVETWEQIEHLLNGYVASHQTALQQDYARHGDVRQQPGFSPEARIAELDAIRRAELDVEIERDHAEQLQEHLHAFDATLRKKGAKKLKSWRRKILDIYRPYDRKPKETLSPLMRKTLTDARRMMDQFPDMFFPPAIDDPELMARLKAIGDFDADPDGDEIEITWPSPAGLASEFGVFELNLAFSQGNREQLGGLLDAVDRLVANFPRHVDQVRSELLESFENYADQMEDWELEDYARDDSGRVTPASILGHARAGSIHLESDEEEPEEVFIELSMGIDWDDEHGFSMSLDED